MLYSLCFPLYAKKMFNILITQPITNVLVVIYQLLSFIGIPYALGFSIIALTVLIRLILYPLTGSQLKASKKMQQVQPHLNRIKDLHKKDPQRLQQETMRLYKEHGINPMAGCLPMLVQLPIIWGLYGVLNTTVRATSYAVINKVLYFDNLKLNKLWDTQFFGLSISQSPAELIKTTGVMILLIPVITGALQFVQTKMMFKSNKTQNKQDKKTASSDFSAAMQTQSLYIFPVMIGFFANSFPIGLSLYWNTFTVFGIIQQYQMDRGKDSSGNRLIKTEPKKRNSK